MMTNLNRHDARHTTLRWTVYRSNSRRLRVALFKAGTRWNKRVLAATFSLWAAGHAALMQQRRAAARMSMRMVQVTARLARRRLAGAFAGWALLTERKVRACRMLARVALRWGCVITMAAMPTSCNLDTGPYTQNPKPLTLNPKP